MKSGSQKNHRKASQQGAPRPIHGEQEPQVERNWTPLPLVFVLGVLFYWGTLYLDRNAAGFDARVYEPFVSYQQVVEANPRDETELFLARGKSVYEQACGPCHQPTGLGLPGQFPPLAGSEWVLAPGAGRMVRITLHGLAGPIEVKGATWNNAMPAVGEALPSEDLAAAISYVRNAWGNKASVLKPEQLAAIKKATAGRSTPWSASELKGVPEAE